MEKKYAVHLLTELINKSGQQRHKDALDMLAKLHTTDKGSNCQEHGGSGGGPTAHEDCNGIGKVGN